MAKFELSLADIAMIQSNAEVVEISAEEARAFFDSGELPDDVATALDAAQGEVSSGEAAVAFLVIKITK